MALSVKQVRLVIYLFGAFCAGYELARFNELAGEGVMRVHAADAPMSQARR